MNIGGSSRHVPLQVGDEWWVYTTFQPAMQSGASQLQLVV